MDEQLKRLSTWIEQLERTAQMMLDRIDVDDEEMKTKERVDCTAKLVTLAQRYHLLRQQREAAEPPARNTVLLSALMRQMRGEVVEEPKTTSTEE